MIGISSFNKLPLLRSVASLKTFPLSKGVRYWRLREQDTEGEFKRGEASLKQAIPLPLDKGKGIKGIGL